MTINLLEHTFSYDREAQLNFQDTMRLFDNNMVEFVSWTATANEEKVRLKLNKEQFTQVYNESVKQKLEKIAHFRDELVPAIEAATTTEELEAIKWGNPGGLVDFNESDTLAKKIRKVDSLEAEGTAQKHYNSFTEQLIMEVFEIVDMGFN